MTEDRVPDSLKTAPEPAIEICYNRERFNKKKLKTPISPFT
ncbi:MAG TPA: hypothetical protein VHY08_27370 [Bacillota bacterium]|nr:hypothetical protein [Bacillota bacterium]